MWKAINAVREIGNIGAHLEKDPNVILVVTPEEADALVRLIETLIDAWYVADFEEKERLGAVEGIGKKKKEEEDQQLREAAEAEAEPPSGGNLKARSAWEDTAMVILFGLVLMVLIYWWLIRVAGPNNKNAPRAFLHYLVIMAVLIVIFKLSKCDGIDGITW